MGDVEVDKLFDKIWGIQKDYNSVTPPLDGVIITEYKNSIISIIEDGYKEIQKFSSEMKEGAKFREFFVKKDTSDLSMLNKIESMERDFVYIFEDAKAIKTNYDLEKFFTKMKNFQETGVYDVRSLVGGRRRNHPKHTDMKMKDIKELCKANQIKLSRVIDDKRVCYKKKELLTKLKRKKVI
jgi:hypothetical protein